MTLARVSNNMLRRLRYATFTSGHLRRFMDAFPGSRILVATSHKQIMGWAFSLRVNGHVHVFLYTNPRYRGHHVAARLIDQILRRYQHITVTAWDDVSWRFYRKLRRQYPGHVTVLDWYKNQWWYNRLLKHRAGNHAPPRGGS